MSELEDLIAEIEESVEENSIDSPFASVQTGSDVPTEQRSETGLNLEFQPIDTSRAHYIFSNGPEYPVNSIVLEGGILFLHLSNGDMISLVSTVPYGDITTNREEGGINGQDNNDTDR